MRFYDEAVNRFMADKRFSTYPIGSIEFFAERFNIINGNLFDTQHLKVLADKENWRDNYPFQDEIMDKEHVVVVTDKHLNIVYATQNMRLMNGYRPEEVIGKTPKLFQGRDTCQKTTQRVAEAIKGLLPFEEILTNYRKDGTSYQCWIKGSPVFDKQGNVVNFIAFEKQVA